MKKLARIVVAAVFLSAAVAPTMAESFYGALDIGQARAMDACADAPAGVVGCESTTTSYRVAGGYQFAPKWGMEVSYGAYRKADMGTFLGVSADWQLSGIQVSGIGTFPVGEAFSLIGKLGVARTTIKISASGFGSDSATSTKLAYGIGAQYNFTESVAARVQYEDLGIVGDANTTGTSKVTLFSAGVVFKF